MKKLLLKFRNEIRSNSKVGDYEELLTLIEKEIDKLEANEHSKLTKNISEAIKLKSDEEIKNTLWQLGYSGVDELSPDEAFDKLTAYYEEFPDEFI